MDGFEPVPFNNLSSEDQEWHTSGKADTFMDDEETDSLNNSQLEFKYFVDNALRY